MNHTLDRLARMPIEDEAGAYALLRAARRANDRALELRAAHYWASKPGAKFERAEEHWPLMSTEVPDLMDIGRAGPAPPFFLVAPRVELRWTQKQERLFAADCASKVSRLLPVLPAWCADIIPAVRLAAHSGNPAPLLAIQEEVKSVEISLGMPHHLSAWHAVMWCADYDSTAAAVEAAHAAAGAVGRRVQWRRSTGDPWSWPVAAQKYTDDVLTPLLIRYLCGLEGTP